MLSPTRRAWALACFSHVPRGFLKIKRASRALHLFTVSVHQGFPTHLFALFSIVFPKCQAQQLGGEEGAIGVPLISPHGTAPVRLAACKEHREKNKTKKCLLEYMIQLEADFITSKPARARLLFDRVLLKMSQDPKAVL